ncbi:hypothetical protein THMIRHAM_19180 [Thiomicrorhabdus immobilis]|uniref:Lipoprotein n=1 Tax=Thiomicrorhabdus immobilis TaxID=2791037 RepID=A0ABM7MFK3_9GAMM|nr:lipoprotein [Thiomicrorhabdus immobilis]BCN94133.1 hypothetical protein THMIRHAM_19180 [Thiomicrorhabdus immobilis]
MPITSKSLFVTVICCSILLSACGKKGPLYLPEEPKSQTSSALTQSNHIEYSALLRLLPTETPSQQEKS